MQDTITPENAAQPKIGRAGEVFSNYLTRVFNPDRYSNPQDKQEVNNFLQKIVNKALVIKTESVGKTPLSIDHVTAILVNTGEATCLAFMFPPQTFDRIKNGDQLYEPPYEDLKDWMILVTELYNKIPPEDRTLIEEMDLTATINNLSKSEIKVSPFAVENHAFSMPYLRIVPKQELT